VWHSCPLSWKCHPYVIAIGEKTHAKNEKFTKKDRHDCRFLLLSVPP